MKKTTFTILALCLTGLAFGQSNSKLIELGEAYKDYMFRAEPAKSVIKDINKDVPKELKTATAFITQTITTKNKLLTSTYLSRPDDKVLKQIFIVKHIDSNLSDENRVDNNKLIDSLNAAEIPTYELVDNYYSMLFAAVGNKNQPFDLSGVDLRLKEYDLKDDTERGIVFLICMEYCGKTIWGYINIPKPPNTKKALGNIKNFPAFNGSVYYQYTDLYFPDFELTITKDAAKQSFKGYYINKYYEVLLNHLLCLGKEGASEKEINDLLLGSILKDKKLYKYTEYKDQLEQIFKEQ